MTAIVYRVTRIWLGTVYGCNVADPDARERYLGNIDDGYGPDFPPECRRGDLLEIEYDDREDWRGVPVDARKIASGT